MVGQTEHVVPVALDVERVASNQQRSEQFMDRRLNSTRAIPGFPEANVTFVGGNLHPEPALKLRCSTGLTFCNLHEPAELCELVRLPPTGLISTSSTRTTPAPVGSMRSTPLYTSEAYQSRKKRTSSRIFRRSPTPPDILWAAAAKWSHFNSLPAMKSCFARLRDAS